MFGVHFGSINNVSASLSTVSPFAFVRVYRAMSRDFAICRPISLLRLLRYFCIRKSSLVRNDGSKVQTCVCRSIQTSLLSFEHANGSRTPLHMHNTNCRNKCNTHIYLNKPPEFFPI